MLDKIVDVSTVITNIFLIMGAVIAAFQLTKMHESNSLQAKNILADHERRKKQSTLEFYSELYPHLSELRTKITDIFSDEYINPCDTRFEGNQDIQKVIYEYLVIVERFSVGINSGIYDVDVFARTSGKTVSDMYKKLSPVINHWRITQNYPEMFYDLEKMSREIDRIRENAYPKPSGSDLEIKLEGCHDKFTKRGIEKRE